MLKTIFFKTCMFAFLLPCAILNLSILTAESPKELPAELFNEFTLNGQIPLFYEYYNQIPEEITIYTTAQLDVSIIKANRKESFFYGETDLHLYHALEELKPFITNKTVGVVGSSIIPWYESILLSYGAKPVVVNHHTVQTSDLRVKYFTFQQYFDDPHKFDLILCLINIPHEGLGRYGDNIDPNADIKLMNILKKMLSPKGKLLISIPIGPDKVVWNAGRIYGEKRLKMLLKGWKTLQYYGFTSEHVFYGVNYRPIFLLEPKL